MCGVCKRRVCEPPGLIKNNRVLSSGLLCQIYYNIILHIRQCKHNNNISKSYFTLCLLNLFFFFFLPYVDSYNIIHSCTLGRVRSRINKINDCLPKQNIILNCAHGPAMTTIRMAMPCYRVIVFITNNNTKRSHVRRYADVGRWLFRRKKKI